ncbi:metallophosphoesterase [Metabacillus iocasae]|uniref:Phosphoesterase n=1 Tax=Priestia iocasae TaxID=2291674 RepID=A0ABS2QPD2_9BACI|nr:metallophosphoesterase [Metabacillus iocasae]MBM7701319.1 putative phosphoesterase [Metabacillus iocasae]
MKVLIVSDSHGLEQELLAIKERHQQEVHAMIHCGDSELSSDSNEMANFLSVRGNCDYDKHYINDRLEQIGELRFLVTHGHLYNVKMSLMNLHYKADETEADVVCFGHSHVAGAEMIDGTLFINPGSILLPRMRKEPTYAILETNGNNIVVHFYEVNGTVMQSMSQTFGR